MKATVTACLGLFAAVLMGLTFAAPCGATPVLAMVRPPIVIQPPPPPADAGLPDIRLEKRITATLADEGKGSILRIPKAWLEARTSTSQPADAATTKHADARHLAAVQMAAAGFLFGVILMVGSWQLLRRRCVNSTLLSVAGAVAIVLLAGAAQAGLVPRSNPNPAPSEMQAGPGQTTGPITLETTATGDEAQLVLSRDIVHTLFAKSDRH
jgi:hypothetical protein